jgi:hypothetical protein
MRLLELTPDEIAFLTAPSDAPDALQDRLTRKLVATLTARLRLPVRLTSHPPAETWVDAPGTPGWQPDAACCALWLTRRLGGQGATGSTRLVPGSLLRMLDAVLAETWLDAAPATTPPALAWHIATDLTQATLAVQLPHSTTDMTRWAREVIRHG